MKATTKSKDFSVRERIAYTAAGLGILLGSFWTIRHWVRKSKENKEQNQSLQDGTPATYAKEIKMAFENDGWFGTNVTELRRVLRNIPSRAVFDKVVTAYNNLYRSNLLKDMGNELQSSEYNEMVSIITAKPAQLKANSQPLYDYKGWAKRLKAAFDKVYGFVPGTDEDAIRAVFAEIPTQQAFQEVAKEYAKEYDGANLTTDLKSELEFWEYSNYMKMILNKPK